MGTVARLFVAPGGHGAMLERTEVRAVENRGFAGCAHGRAGSGRQVLLVESETLRELGLAPGVVRENVTTEGIRLAEVQAGTRLRMGSEAVLEVTIPCEPCGKLEAIRTGLQDKLQGRRGIMCRVITGGLIRRGDPVEALGRAEAYAAASQQAKQSETRKVGSA